MGYGRSCHSDAFGTVEPTDLKNLMNRKVRETKDYRMRQLDERKNIVN